MFFAFFSVFIYLFFFFFFFFGGGGLMGGGSISYHSNQSVQIIRLARALT